MLQLQDAEKTVDVAGGSSLNDDSGDRQTVPDVCCDPVFIDFLYNSVHKHYNSHYPVIWPVVLKAGFSWVLRTREIGH